MARLVRFAVALALTVAGVALLGRAPEGLARFEIFRVDRVELEGARYLTLAEAVERLGLGSDASVWDDPGPWEMALVTHPLVSEARVRRRLPGTLVLDVRERTPVAFLPTPTLEPVDRTGLRLPVDPAIHPLDLPLLDPGEEGVDPRAVAGRVRRLAVEAARLGDVAPGFLARVSELELDARGDLTARGNDLPVTFRFRPGSGPRRFGQALRVMEDALGRRGLAAAEVDLRYADQMVVRAPAIPQED